MSITEAVSMIAKEFGFFPLVEPHPEKFSQLTIAGHSYWEWMVEQAKRIGYALKVEGTSLWFQSLDSTILSSLADSPEFTDISTYETNTPDTERNMTFFRVFRGDYVETPGDLNTVKQVSGVDSSSGKSLSIKDSNGDRTLSLRDQEIPAPFNEYRSDQVSRSVRSAEFRVKGLRSTARYTVPAHAHVTGDPRITPFSTTLISGMETFTEGYWVVKEVEHNIQDIGTYVSEIKLLGDGSGKGSLRGGAATADRRMGIVNVSNALSGKNIWGNSGKQDGVRLRGSRSTPQNVSSGFSRSSARWAAR
jgi:hypothetical protein